jgi:alpha-amylase
MTSTEQKIGAEATGRDEAAPPLRFAMGLHIHQPVGNFDHVFAQHVSEVYQPFLNAVSERGFLPVALHISGPLLEWLEKNAGDYLDLVGRLAADGKLELLLAGMYEPILVSLPHQDRVEQILWMREALERRFGVRAEGLWLTERVWEPELVEDLAAAQVRFALVDDRHFLVTGFRREQLHAPYWTEAQGKQVALFPIDERLRYLIPFRPASEIVEYFEDLRDAGHRLAVFADDGEKFGGWPGTREWVYQRGWLNQFIDAVSALCDDGMLQLSTFAKALDEVPSNGLAYLPSASYREMEEWSLPPAAASRLGRLSEELGEERLRGPDGALVRGGHWRNFLAKYPESNRIHKKMQRLSFLCRDRGNPPAARRAIGRAQCNDAYWHGVFGGLYLPHLRRALWEQLAMAERELRSGEGIAVEQLDFDGDGHPEVWVHSDRFSAMVSPRRGGAIEEYTVFEAGKNFADTLTRRREAYHEKAVNRPPPTHGSGESGTPSIHELENAVSLSALPPMDLEDRALFVDRVLAGALRFDEYSRGSYRPIRSWARAPMAVTTESSGQGVDVVCRPRNTEDQWLLEKRIRLDPKGGIQVSYRWNPVGLPADSFFSTELTLSEKLRIRVTPDVPLWTFAVQTVAKSERGLDETLQGESITARWPIGAGSASIEITPRPA